MKISELINNLKVLKEENGDLDVFCHFNILDETYIFDIVGEEASFEITTPHIDYMNFEEYGKVKRIEWMSEDEYDEAMEDAADDSDDEENDNDYEWIKVCTFTKEE